MLRCSSSKLTRSTLVTSNTFSGLQSLSINKQPTIYPIYHKAIHQSSKNTVKQINTMSGSALDSLQELMSMIDEFEANIQNKPSAPKQAQAEQKYNAPQQVNINLPPFLLNTHLPLSIIFWLYI